MATFPLTAPPSLALLNGTSKLFDIVPAVVSSTGAADAFKPLCLNSVGLLDPAVSGAGISVTAGSGIPSGSLLNLYSNAGTLTARLASAESGPGSIWRRPFRLTPSAQMIR